MVFLSDSQPILCNGKVIWYVMDNSRPAFYTLDDDGVNKFLMDSRDQFTDLVDNVFYLAPVVWAFNEGVTSDTSDTAFSVPTTIAPTVRWLRSNIGPRAVLL